MDIESFKEDLRPIAEEARTALAQVLDSEQMMAFSEFLANLDQEALEAIRSSLVEKLAAALELREDQLPKLKPILRQHIEKLGTLLRDFSQQPDRSPEKFKSDYETLREETRAKVEKVLDEEQLRKLTERQDEARERIQQLLF